MLLKKFSFFLCLLFLSITASDFIYAINETVPPEMLKLSSKLHGKWKGYLTLRMDEKEMTIKDMVEFTQVSDGMGICMIENFIIDNGAENKSVNLITYDAVGDVIHWYTVLNTGETRDNIVKWIDDKTFSITYSGIENNKSYESYNECKFIEDEYLNYKKIVRLNNVVIQEMIGQYVRE